MLVGTRTTTPTGCNSCTFDKDRRAVEVSTSYTGRRDDSRPQQTAECLMLRSHVRASVGLNPGTGEVESRSTWGGRVSSDIRHHASAAPITAYEVICINTTDSDKLTE